MSAPSVYQKLRELHRDAVSVCIFEYDRRFAAYGEDFVYYDYKNPVDLPERIATHSFDIVVADPPYLSEECLRKMSETIKLLTRGKILLCTGGCWLTTYPVTSFHLPPCTQGLKCSCLSGPVENSMARRPGSGVWHGVRAPGVLSVHSSVSTSNTSGSASLADKRNLQPLGLKWMSEVTERDVRFGVPEQKMLSPVREGDYPGVSKRKCEL